MTPDFFQRFAKSTLSHVRREYPHGLAHVLEGPSEIISPARLHPAFFGSYDWHSCVHGWWQLLWLSRKFEVMRAEVYAAADSLLTAETLGGELEYLQLHPSFERPYGWAWLLALHQETLKHDRPWGDALEPLAVFVEQRFREYLAKLTYPVRAGTHANSAFALILAHDWASSRRNDFVRVISEWAIDRFQNEVAAPHLEPSGEDFLSPTLTTAHLMSKLLPPDAFLAWFGGYLPGGLDNLLEPVRVSDRSDGRIGHLDGLNLSRAWSLRHISRVLPQPNPTYENSSDRHLAASLAHVAEGYMAEHWLATFAVLAMTT